MEVIELDKEFFDSVKNDKREDIVNGIVNNVMRGKCEYQGSGENWNLQDFVNDALGDYDVSQAVSLAVSTPSKGGDAMASVRARARGVLRGLVASFCNQNDVGIA